MPTQHQLARDAINKIREAINDLAQEWRDTVGSDDYKKGKKGAKDKLKEIKRKHGNLKAVYDALRTAEIVVDPTLPDHVLGRSKPHSTPQKIRLSEDTANMRDAAVAQILAHEAIHLITKSSRNSLEEEVLCRKKEVEVWELLKGGELHSGDKFCNEEQKLMALPEFDYKLWIFNQYMTIDCVLPLYIEKGSSKKKKNKLRVVSSSSIFRQALGVTRRFIGDLIDLFTLGHQTEQVYGFETNWAPGFEWAEIQGDEDRYRQIVGTLVSQDSEIFPTVISVGEEPDVMHGGQWAEFIDLAEYKREVFVHLNGDLLDANPKVLQDEACTVGGHPGHCLDVEFDRIFEDAPPGDPRCRLRSRTLLTKRDETIYQLQLTCVATRWIANEAAFEQMVMGFRLRD